MRREERSDEQKRKRVLEIVGMISPSSSSLCVHFIIGVTGDGTTETRTKKQTQGELVPSSPLLPPSLSQIPGPTSAAHRGDGHGRGPSEVHGRPLGLQQ